MYNSVINANSSSISTDSGAIHISDHAGVNMQMAIHDNYVQLADLPTTGLDVGIYLDDYTSGATVTNNIVTGGNFGFLIHGGQNDTLSNNIFDLGTRTASNIGAGLIQSEPGGPIAVMTGDQVLQNIIYSTAASPSTAWYGMAAAPRLRITYTTILMDSRSRRRATPVPIQAIRSL